MEHHHSNPNMPKLMNYYNIELIYYIKILS